MVHLKPGTRHRPARTNHTFIRIRALLLLHRTSGTPAKIFFPTKVLSLAGVREGGVGDGSCTHEGVRVKAETLAPIRAARSMVERSLLVCLSSLYDLHPQLVPGICQCRTTTNISRIQARLHRSSGMPAKICVRSFVLLPYLHGGVRVEGGNACI